MLSRATRKPIVWLVPLLAMALPLVALAQAGAPKIGYVDMKRLLDQAPQVLAARQKLQREFASRDASLQAAQQRLDSLKAKLANDRSGLSPDQIDSRQHKIDTLAGSVRRAREKMQQDLKSRSDQALQRSWQTISDAAVDYARAHGYDLLLPSPVIYASSKVDVTDAILDRLRHDFNEDTPP